MKTIKSISEAYSCQPKQISITSMEHHEKFKFDEDIKIIKLELVQIGTAMNCEWMYCCYDFKDNLRWQFLANSVNVEYDYNDL